MVDSCKIMANKYEFHRSYQVLIDKHSAYFVDKVFTLAYLPVNHVKVLICKPMKSIEDLRPCLKQFRPAARLKLHHGI